MLTGGFPCQPFSQAGKRKGVEDDRFLWPEMLRVIQEFSPLWVIAENVRGLLTQGGGVVFERVCTDLEAAGYEVQPLIIPAVAVNAPHRRDRVWFVGHTKHDGRNGSEDGQGSVARSDGNKKGSDELREPARPALPRDASKNTIIERTHRRVEDNGQILERESTEAQDERPDWSANWFEVATRLCRVDDGVSTWVDGHGKKRNSRNARLKALGNAIVPAVAVEIMKAIKISEQRSQTNQKIKCR